MRELRRLLTTVFVIACVGMSSVASANLNADSEAVMDAQVKLKTLGYDVPTTGRVFHRTMRAIKTFQRKQGMVEDGNVTAALLLKLSVIVREQSDKTKSKKVLPSDEAYVWIEADDVRLETRSVYADKSLCAGVWGMDVRVFTSDPSLFREDYGRLKDLLARFGDAAEKKCPDMKQNDPVLRGYVDGHYKFHTSVRYLDNGEVHLSYPLDMDVAYAEREHELKEQEEKKAREELAVKQCRETPKRDLWLAVSEESASDEPSACELMLALNDHYVRGYSRTMTPEEDCNLMRHLGCSFLVSKKEVEIFFGGGVASDIGVRVTMTHFAKGRCNASGECQFAATLECLISRNPLENELLCQAFKLSTKHQIRSTSRVVQSAGRWEIVGGVPNVATPNDLRPTEISKTCPKTVYAARCPPRR